MIQVCSRCGTRWNVRDRQRVWCPRCHGTLLAPSASAPSAPPAPAPPPDGRWAPSPSAPSQPPAPGAQPRPASRLPAGYRWIAVRPGSGPPPRRPRRPLGPTPRYVEIPRWGLHQPFEVEGQVRSAPTAGSNVGLVRVLTIITMVLFGLTALSYLVRYALMLVNRSVLIAPIVDDVVTWGAVVLSVFALFALIGTGVALAFWLVARREAAFAHYEKPDSRGKGELFAGCLIPIVNLFFAPVFVIELAMLEARYRDLRKPIVIWWCLWVVSFLLSTYAAVAALPPFTRDIQSVADSNLITAIGYVFALAALGALYKVFNRFERTAVDKQVKRWVIVRDEGQPVQRETAESPIPVESERRDPAA